MSQPPAPLEGLRVLDLSRVLAGPVSGRLLAEMGAQVVKLEPPGQDLIRWIAPADDRGMSGLYTLANLGKRNICVDLGRDEGREIVLGLVRWADAVLENFRPGVMEKLGLGWETLHRENPRLVLLSINGYGSDSPLRERRAFAPVIHAVSGVLQYASEWRTRPRASGRAKGRRACASAPSRAGWRGSQTSRRCSTASRRPDPQQAAPDER